MKIFFFGTSFFAKEILRLLLENGFDFSWIITQPDKPAGRRKIPLASEVKKFSLQKNLRLKEFGKIDNEAFYFLQKNRPDLIIVAAYGVIFPEKLLTLPEFGCLNFHASLLPKFRGPAPIQTVLLSGRKTTGMTLMRMDKKVDHGEIVFQKKVSIDSEDDYFSLEKKLITASKALFPKIKSYTAGTIPLQKQNHRQATFTKMIKKPDGKINWSLPAQKIFNQYRAYKKWPGIFSFWKNKKISLLEIELGKKKTVEPPGSVISGLNKEILIATGNKATVEVKCLQLEGKKPLMAKEFINGYKDFIGSRLE